MEEEVGECVHGRRVDGRTGGPVYAQMEEWAGECVYGWKNGWANVCMDGRWMEEQVGECVHGRKVDGWMDGDMSYVFRFWRRFSD
jgi:hypothetical protein